MTKSSSTPSPTHPHTASSIPSAGTRARRAFVIAIAGTLLLYVIPFGGALGYPLVLLSTYAHELGHGLAALLVGAKFEQLVIYASTGGVATHVGAPSDVARALISAGGLVGPALLAFVLFLAAPYPRLAKVSVFLFGLSCLVVDVLFVRNMFGVLFVGGMGLFAMIFALKTSAEATRTLTVFLAIQLSLSVFSRGDYLFMKEADLGDGQVLPSDVQNIADNLGGVYLGWGAIIGAISIAVLVVGGWLFFRKLDDD